jgi:hypothetical protein
MYVSLRRRPGPSGQGSKPSRAGSVSAVLPCERSGKCNKLWQKSLEHFFSEWISTDMSLAFGGFVRNRPHTMCHSVRTMCVPDPLQKDRVLLTSHLTCSNGWQISSGLERRLQACLTPPHPVCESFWASICESGWYCATRASSASENSASRGRLRQQTAGTRASLHQSEEWWLLGILHCSAEHQQTPHALFRRTKTCKGQINSHYQWNDPVGWTKGLGGRQDQHTIIPRAR